MMMQVHVTMCRLVDINNMPFVDCSSTRFVGGSVCIELCYDWVLGGSNTQTSAHSEWHNLFAVASTKRALIG